MVDEEQLKAIRERAYLATKGPWAVSGVMRNVEVSCPGNGVIADLNPQVNAVLNGEFIAHAREDIPVLLSEIDRLQRCNRDLSEALRELHNHQNKEESMV